MTDNWLRTVLPKLTEGYTDSQIWNAVETGLFFKLTPDRTLKFKGEKCTGGKLSKDRITVLVASINYDANKKAWMTSKIFEKVLRKWDSQLGNKKKIILFIDNCPAHPQIQNLTNIKLTFLPANTTSVIQPIDQGTIRSLKSHYGKLLGHKMTSNTTDDDSDDELDNLPLAKLSSAEATVTDWEIYVNIDDRVITTDNLSDNEIIESVHKKRRMKKIAI
ncbi:Tigger transposable element-derived protein 4 [Eumeta japonica]|uniref:Tigger transposable element-derived protein 4 n=1 Tax=Eumeta variegata TaxID=151549 RepID=A0A4C1TDD5_EUMVA|nr:Tigger transposable element-derived protein 4 [Eumeta japonica]